MNTGPPDEGFPKPGFGSQAARSFLADLQARIYISGKYDAWPRPLWDLPELQERLLQAGEQAFLGQYEEAAKFLGEHVTSSAKESARRQAQNALRAEAPTFFENPVLFRIVADRIEKVENAVRAIQRSVSLPAVPRPLVGSLPTGRVNAMAIRVPNSGEHIIVFETELPLFCLLFCKAIALALPFEETDGGVMLAMDETSVRERINSDPSIVEKFYQLVEAYVVEGLPSRVPPYRAPEPWAQLARLLIQSMEFFIVAHEYSHILRGHVGSRGTTASLLGDATAEVLEWSHQQEYEADALGVLLLMASPDAAEADTVIRFAGVALFFHALSIMQRAVTLLRTGEERESASRTHPASSTRLEVARGFTEQIGIRHEDRPGIVEVTDALRTVIEELWRRSRPRFYSLRERGIGPHRMWSLDL